MASRETELDLRNPEKAKLWIMMFEAKARAKKWQDTKETKDITNNFLASCGMDALSKINCLGMSKSLEKLNFCNIKEKIMEFIEPKAKLILSERIIFFKYDSVRMNH